MSVAIIDMKLFQEIENDNLLKTTLKQLIKAFNNMNIDIKIEKLENTEYLKDEKFYDLIKDIPSKNNKLDNYLLYSIYDNKAHYLITDDEGIHEKAKVLGINNKVMPLKIAYDMFAINNTIGRKFPKHYW